MELAQMGQEEKTQKCTSPSNGFSRSCSSNPRKTKQKKVPQRGLGVAQLEKIRLEEQQKKAVSVLTSPTPVASNHSLPSPPTKSSPCVVPPNPSTIRHYYPHSNSHHHQPPSSIPFPSLPSLDLPLPKSNSIFRPPSFHAPSNVDVVRKPNSTSTTVPLHNNNGFEMQGNGNAGVPKLWNPNCEYNSVDLNKDNSSGAVDPGYAFRPSMNNLPSFDQSNPSWSIPNFHQRPQQYHHHHHQPPPPPPPPSLVNVSSTTSSSSSVVNIHTEPPSNQSYYSNYPTPMWSEEEKMLGIKRSYPFSLENGSGPSNNFKFPTFVAPPIRTDEITSCKNRGGTFNLDPAGNPIYREGPTCSTSIPESNSKSSIKENGSVNREFLTLAPPTSNRTCPNPKSNAPSAFQAFHCPEVPDYSSFPYRVSSEDTTFQPGPSSSTPQQAFYTFIPPAKPHIVKPAATINNCNGEVGESVDLSLKL